MKNTWKLLPLAALAVVLFGCGGGGGTPDPQSIADGVVDAIKGENFTKVYDYYPQWMKDIGEGESARQQWRSKESYGQKWADYKTRFEGDNGLDPKDASKITNSEEKWWGASPAERAAVDMGLYRIQSVDGWEKRLKESDWWLVSRKVNLSEEGEGTATFRYSNRFADGIEVTCFREGGLWYLAGVEVKFDKKEEEKRKD